jgi:hypothetical protein
MRNHHREHDHIQIGKEPSASHILPQPYAPQQTTPFTGPPASLTTESPPKMADEAIESDLVSNAKAHRKAVRVIYPLSTNRSRIPRPWPQSQQKRNPSFIPTPHLDLDSDSESDSSVYTAPEIPIDLENYMGLKIRNDIHELE